MKNTITSVMVEKRIIYPSAEFSQKAHIKSFEEYKELYKKSIENPELFWSEVAQEYIDWYKKWDKVYEGGFENLDYKYFIGGKLNASYNCLDRHIKSFRRNKVAIIWEGDSPGESKVYTYRQLFNEVNKFANVLKKNGVKKGDRITIYLPMIPELPIAMLACARIGAIHSVVFGGFSSKALCERIHDAQSNILITANVGFRGGKVVALKANTDEALLECPMVEKCIVVKRADVEVSMKEDRDTWWHEEIAAPDIELYCEPEVIDSEDILFILYTSGSTGKPKGVIHTTGGYLTYVAYSFKLIFDYKDEDIFWCTADIGWVTGHSYLVYGPLAVGATSLMFEGVPTYPQPDRFWEVIEKYRVNIFYTAPTAIRALMREGDEWPNKHDLSCLRLLGTVGEPINPEVWMWYFKTIGKEKCPVVDTWWQTETGGILVTPLPGAMPLKPGSATLSFPGVVSGILREDGTPVSVNEGGYFVIKHPWPAMLRGMYGDVEKKRFRETYFEKFPGVYTTSDGARLDEDGYYWLMGRIDDVINVSGHRLGTAEVESALTSHKAVAEAAVVGFPHEIKGQGIYAFVTLKEGYAPSDSLREELVNFVRKEIGPIAKPDKLQFAEMLPKTRSGKIMRRILRKIASGDVSDLGDTSTLLDSSVVDILVKERL